MVQQCKSLLLGRCRFFGAGLTGGLCSGLCLGGGFGLGFAATLGRGLLFRSGFCLGRLLHGLFGLFLRGLFSLGLGGAGGFLCGRLLCLFRGLVLRFLAGGALCRHLKIEGAHGRQGDGDALLKAVQRLLLGANRLVMDSTGAAEFRIITVQDLFISTGDRGTQRIALAQDGVEVADHQHLLAGGILAQERHHALLRVVRDDPLEALPAVIDLPERRRVLVELVQRLDIVLQLGVLIVIQQHPVQRLCLVPLGELTELLAHEEQLLAGDLDMFFGYNSVSNTRLSYETIYEDCLVAILPKSHPAVSFAESKESCIYPWLDLAHVRKERFILQHSNQSIRQLEEDALFYADVLPELTYKISSIDAGIRLAEQGYGIAFTLNSYLTSMKLSPDSVVLQVGDPDMRIPFSAAFRKEDENRKELKEWIRLTKELVSRQ